MNTRGLVELIVLNLGYDLGILSPRMFTMMVIMALTTTFMTGPLLQLRRLVDRRESHGDGGVPGLEQPSQSLRRGSSPHEKPGEPLAGHSTSFAGAGG